MGDYGFRISQDGKDVKTCEDKECVITSKYATLKGSISGGGATTCADGGLRTITVAHNLGYIPYVRAFLNPTDSDDFNNDYYQLPIWVDGIMDHLYASVYVDSTNVYIEWEQWNGDALTRNYNYKYFIFLDKAKV